MNEMLIPSRVLYVLAALKSQGFTLEFSLMADGDINLKVFNKGEFKYQTYLRSKIDYDMYDTPYETLCNLADAKLQTKSAAVLEFLEELKEA